MPLTHFGLFLITSIVIIVAPGPDTLNVLARSIGQGRTAGFFTTLGTCSGLLVHTTAAALGLAALFQASAVAYYVVKIVGAAYLLYLGVRTILSKHAIGVSTKPPVSQRRLYVQGILTNVLNPKLPPFFLAFLPQFADPHAGAIGLQILMMGLIFALITLLYLSLIALASGSISRSLLSRPAWANRLRWVTGSVLVGLGVRLALPEQR
jgi:threonine/homoserine/homoserine lactone efflux protein